MPKPTILLVHGAWHTPTHYIPYTTALKSAGYEVYTPHLPTCTGISPPQATFADDVACIRTLLTRLVHEGKRILLIMHSYGGCVGTDAVQDLVYPYPRPTTTSSTSTENGAKKGGVIHLLYLCAYMLLPGESIQRVMEKTGVDGMWGEFMEDGSDGMTVARDPGKWFFGGLEEGMIRELVGRLVRFPVGVIRARTEGDAWRRVPVTYVVTERDYAVPRMFQNLMLKEVKREGVEVQTQVFDTSHSVFLTKLEEMVDVAVRAAEDQRNVR
ncbi:alpha/beta hydrolase [Aspergillus alliaceus]|uniref:alpha/beta hydrolase n=1 Tax=Petromyces alliaceus TaxID=209559 RepID=UPI0012A5FE1F|nr:Alpha/beta hydrolase fold-1 [Aspergillus alliaceus]KAB8232399.1 Alpha/beta hydrolase fold-1 [Aspergillus alliaceus]